jgi:hypothetical protein
VGLPAADYDARVAVVRHHSDCSSTTVIRRMIKVLPAVPIDGLVATNAACGETPSLHVDDTPVPVLAPGAVRTKTGRLWIYVRDERPFGGPRQRCSSTRRLARANTHGRTSRASPA